MASAMSSPSAALPSLARLNARSGVSQLQPEGEAADRSMGSVMLKSPQRSGLYCWDRYACRASTGELAGWRGPDAERDTAKELSDEG